jgi:hypothetical protein
VRGELILRTLAREVEPFNMWTPGAAEPPDSKDHGHTSIRSISEVSVMVFDRTRRPTKRPLPTE